MPIKPYRSIEDQKKTLLTRGLSISDDDIFNDYILKNNYFNVINGNEDLLLVDSAIVSKSYDTATFEDFIRLHKFDKKLSKELLSIIHNFETRLKTSIAKNFCKNYCLVEKHTMQYTNKANYENIKSKNRANYTLYHDQYESIVDGFDDFILFKNNFLANLVKKNDFIDENIFSALSTDYTPPKGCNSFEINAGSKPRQVVVPLWVAIETLDFGALQRFCHYLKPNGINGVMKDFHLGPTDRELFLNSLDVIRELRNKCAHFSLINRFITSMNVKILPSLISRLNLVPKESFTNVYIPHLNKKVRKNPAKLSLFDTLKVIGMYEDLSRLKQPMKAIIYQNNKHFKRNTYDLNKRLLERMGNSNYREWKDMLK